MKVLAIDSSSLVASVCIIDEEKVIIEHNIDHKLTHSETIMPMLDNAFNSSELSPDEVDVYAVAIGPGSFTGLRIGVGTIKGLAQGTSKPVIGVSTLDGLANNVKLFEGIICPIMDARRNQVYSGIYKKSEGKVILEKDNIAISIEELVKIIKKYNERVIFVGDAVNIHMNYLKSVINKGKCFFAPLSLRSCKATSIASIALERFKQNKFESYKELKPYYLRKSQAERELASK